MIGNNTGIINNLIEYLEYFKPKSWIKEENYIDQDFLLDYQTFYCRLSEKIDRFTIRIHFFKNDFNKNTVKNNIVNIYNIKKLINKDTYLGFIIIKPLYINGTPLIGRSCLKTHKSSSNSLNEIYITNKNSVSLLGIKLIINSIPYQQQDSMVSASATIALWTVLRPLKYVSDIKNYSPSQITENANLSTSLYRGFPSQGLTLEQMVYFIKSNGLDIELIKIVEYDSESNNDIITTAIKAFINAKIPIIAIISLVKTDYNNEVENHAVVITGLKLDSERNITELYVHDDQIGPYSKVLSMPTNSNRFLEWDSKWKQLYDEIRLDMLLIPISKKLQLSFYKIYSVYKSLQVKIMDENLNFQVELLLENVNDYKEFLLNQNIDDKYDKLAESLPRFLWILRHIYNSEILVDMVYDGVSTHIRRLLLISYRTEKDILSKEGNITEKETSSKKKKFYSDYIDIDRFSEANAPIENNLEIYKKADNYKKKNGNLSREDLYRNFRL